MDIAGGLAAITEAMKLVKALSDVDRQLDAATFKMKMADAISALADAKVALSDAQDERREQEKQIAQLKAAFGFQGETVEYGGYRYRRRLGESDQPAGMPFCSVCEVENGRFMQLTHGLTGSMNCPACKAGFRNLAEF